MNRFATSLAVMAALGPTPRFAQTPAKTDTMIIGFGPGGNYDMWGRAIARFIGKQLPGQPDVVAQNMPGAGSYVATSWIYNLAPKDGSTFGIVARDAALGPLIGAQGARFDPLKISWLGTPTVETNVCIANAAAPVKSMDALREHTLIIGDTGPGTGTRSYPLTLNAILGFKFKLVSGFPSSSDVFLAMERGEVDGICESLDSIRDRRPNWIADKTVNVLFQGGVKPDAAIPGVPLVIDEAKTPQERAEIAFLYAGQRIGRPFVAPPLPADKLKILRDAFDATVRDPDFVAAAKQARLNLAPESGAELERVIDDIYATPKPIVEKIGKLMQQ